MIRKSPCLLKGMVVAPLTDCLTVFTTSTPGWHLLFFLFNKRKTKVVYFDPVVLLMPLTVWNPMLSLV